jgi:hypothetical protein
MIDGVEVACTGIGMKVRDDPRWKAFPVRVEFSNTKRDYLADIAMSVANKKGAPLLNVACEAPWVLMNLHRGNYRLVAQREDHPYPARSAVFRVPSKGQYSLDI